MLEQDQPRITSWEKWILNFVNVLIERMLSREKLARFRALTAVEAFITADTQLPSETYIPDGKTVFDIDTLSANPPVIVRLYLDERTSYSYQRNTQDLYYSWFVVAADKEGINYVWQIVDPTPSDTKYLSEEFRAKNFVLRRYTHGPGEYQLEQTCFSFTASRERKNVDNTQTLSLAIMKGTNNEDTLKLHSESKKLPNSVTRANM